jgi:5-methylcytosine-specific restriction endonuclease McrA
MSNLSKLTVLSLNASWQAIEVVSPQKAFRMMASGAAVGLDTSCGNLSPIDWDKWIDLDVPDGEDCARTAKRAIRVPRVIVAVNYKHVRPKKIHLNVENAARLQNFECAYTRKKLDRTNWSLDHVLPTSRGGADEWPNIVAAHKDVNSKKSNKTPEEAGLSLLIKPRVPPKLMPADYIKYRYGIKHKEWEMFVGSGN